MTCLGIDPGLASTGWGVIRFHDRQIPLVEYGIIATDSDCSAGERLLSIHQQVRDLVDRFQPDICGIETLFFSKNITSALPVAQARGVVLMTLQMSGIPLAELAPNQIKKTVVGIAKAQKEQVSEMIRIILGLREIPRPSHAADALAIAYCASQQGVTRHVS